MTGMVLPWLDGLTSGGHLSVCSPENDNITLFSSHEVIGYPLHSDSQKKMQSPYNKYVIVILYFLI